jgi:opacity protein-like surface antigen
MRKVFGWEDNEGRGDSAIEWCTDPRASNYKRDATVDDGSCEVSSGGWGWGWETNPQCTITVNAYEWTTQTEFSFSVQAQGEYDTVKLDFGDRTEQQEVTRSVVSKTYRQEWVYTVNAILSIDSGGPASLSAGGTVARCTLKWTITINGTEWWDWTWTSTADDTRTCENKATNYPNCNACEDWFELQNNTCTATSKEVLWCTDPDANNTDPDATQDDWSCTYDPVLGCTDPSAINYDAQATKDDGSCDLWSSGWW